MFKVRGGRPSWRLMRTAARRSTLLLQLQHDRLLIEITMFAKKGCIDEHGVPGGQRPVTIMNMPEDVQTGPDPDDCGPQFRVACMRLAIEHGERRGVRQ